jgi:hypothetical protein
MNDVEDDNNDDDDDDNGTVDACNRVLITSKGFVIHAATVPATPPDIRLLVCACVCKK